MTARRAYDMSVDVSITIATPEDAPLAIFGSAVSEAVQAAARAERHPDDHLRALRGSRAGTGRRSIPAGDAARRPGGRPAAAVRPLDARGPEDAHDGFIPIDMHCQVRGSSVCTRPATRPTSPSSTAGSPLSRPTPPPRRSPRSPARRSSRAVSPGDPRDPARRREAAVPERPRHRRTRVELGESARSRPGRRRPRSPPSTSRRT